MSNIFIHDISINYIKYNFYEFINLYCVKDKTSFILFNKEIYIK